MSPKFLALISALVAVAATGTSSSGNAASLSARVFHVMQAGDAAGAFPNVPRHLAMALVIVESAGNPRAVSGKNAMGLTQVMPATAMDLGVYRSSLLVTEPVVAITAGLRYLSQMVDRSCGAIRPALAAYYAGPGRVEKCSNQAVPAIASGYVHRVTTTERFLSYCVRNEQERVCLRRALTAQHLR